MLMYWHVSEVISLHGHCSDKVGKVIKTSQTTVTAHVQAINMHGPWLLCRIVTLS